MYDVVLFNNSTSRLVKTLGAHRVAYVLRQAGYSVKVINHTSWLMLYKEDELKEALKKWIGKNTLFVGMSFTFMGTLRIPKLKKSNYIKTRTVRKFESEEDYEDKREKDLEYINLFKNFIDYIRSLNSDTKIVVGGAHNNREVIFSHYGFDYDIVGYADNTVVEFANKLKNGIFPIEKTIDYDTLADNFDFHNIDPTFTKEDVISHQEVLPLELSRGCRFKCKFCAYALIGKNPADDRYTRSYDSIVKELAWNYENFGTVDYFFLCDTFNETSEKLERIIKAMDHVGIRLNFWAYIRLELLRAHPEQIELLKYLGIRVAHFGIETLNHDSGKIIGKGLHPDKVAETLQECKRIWGNQTLMHSNFVIGFPKETKKTVDYWTNKYLKDTSLLDSVTFRPLSLFANKSAEHPNHVSEFMNNPRKYGYEFDEKGRWYNEDMRYQQAKKLAENLTKVINISASYDFMDFRSLGYTWEEITSKTSRRKQSLVNNYYSNYANALLGN